MKYTVLSTHYSFPSRARRCRLYRVWVHFIFSLRSLMSSVCIVFFCCYCVVFFSFFLCLRVARTGWMFLHTIILNDRNLNARAPIYDAFCKCILSLLANYDHWRDSITMAATTEKESFFFKLKVQNMSVSIDGSSSLFCPIRLEIYFSFPAYIIYIK